MVIAQVLELNAVIVELNRPWPLTGPTITMALPTSPAENGVAPTGVSTPLDGVVMVQLTLLTELSGGAFAPATLSNAGGPDGDHTRPSVLVQISGIMKLYILVQTLVEIQSPGPLLVTA